MNKLLVFPLFAYCAFATCGVVAPQTVRQPVRQADTLRVARPSWLFVPLDSLRTADILPLRPIRSVLADVAVFPMPSDSTRRPNEVKLLLLAPVRQDRGAEVGDMAR